MYVAPLRMLPAAVPMDVVLTSAAIVVPISVLVGEIVAAKVHALTLAQRESEHRAELLRAVSKACRVISTLDRAAVLAAVADALAEIGFGASAFTFFTADGSRYRLEEARNLPAEYERETHEANGTLTGLVRMRRTTVVLSDYSSADVMHPVLAASQFGATIATPVWVSGALVGALIATTKERIRFTTQDVEAIELLAAQAGRALENAKTFQTEVSVRHQLIADSTRDVLTGITLLESLRTGDALSLIDLDHFKSVNDTYGHAAGDAVLTELGAFLTNRLRDGDDVARFGGEEFLLVLRNADAHQAAAILTRLTDDWRRMARHATFSTGYSVHQRGADPAETLGNADSALYAAKAAGRDRVRAFVPTARSKPTGSTRLSIGEDGPSF
jgi:diguanylate cyclase (GGDEF)-like protein